MSSNLLVRERDECRGLCIGKGVGKAIRQIHHLAACRSEGPGENLSQYLQILSPYVRYTSAALQEVSISKH